MTRRFPQKPPKKAAGKAVKPWQDLISRHSPYLTSIGAASCAGDANKSLAKLLQETHSTVAKITDSAPLMKALRLGKRSLAALTAAADLRGVWDDRQVMAALSAYADLAVGAALRFLLRAAHDAGAVKLKNRSQPEKDCGVSIIALGKWGAHELNYSSDIDLMVIFDPARAPVVDSGETQNFFIRLTRDLARLLDQPTQDGYVFRTDLRLRPDPGAMPLAVSIGAAETYYGSLGQNWERAAMIKARPVAGDAAVGADFQRIMQSWIWRRNLDFAAIQDIHSIKRQINAKQSAERLKSGGAKSSPWYGFNVKLGHGGIREIEFFAQTQQLIYGGRELSLRSPETLIALAALAATGHITADMRDALTAAYLFLRRVEHRLQMVDDRQTHSLPASKDGFDEFSAFMEYATPAAFAADLETHTGAVKKLYAGLFTESPSLAETGNLVFTGVEDDPETLVTLSDMGFAEPAKITAAIRGWHHGRYRAVRSERARQILTEITPHLLSAFAATPHPDDAFIRFDAFLARLPSGIPIFSMFQRHPQQMELVADVMGSSPALAEHLGTHPEVLEGVLSRDFFGGLPDLDALKSDLDRRLRTARDYQDILDIARQWAREKRFHAGIHLLKSLSPQPRCARYFADIAEAALCGMIPAVEKEFAQAHGAFKSGQFLVLAMGSFAAREMFADSDLDIIALYRVGAKEKLSNGPKPLQPNVYYIRLMQRLIAAMSAPTAEGILYPVDARLRPAGEDGPLAAQLDGFYTYQRNDAWAWEHMSLIRSRLVHAPAKTAAEFTAEVAKILSAKQDTAELRAEMLDMRAKVEKQFGSTDPWDLKNRRGGMMDVMFAVHFLILKNAAKFKGLIHPALADAIAALKKKKLLTDAQAKALENAHRDAQAVQAFLRLCAELPFEAEDEPEGLKSALAVSMGMKKNEFAKLSGRLDRHCAASYAAYKKILGTKS